MTDPTADAARFTVDAEHAGLRVDVVISRIASAARGVVTDAARDGRLHINGRAVKGSTLTVEGDDVSYQLTPASVLDVQPQALPINVIFEDETVIVVNKAAGMVTHPAHGAPDGTLVNALLAHVGMLPGEPTRAGLIHRLDRDTSGLLLIAKTAAALSTLGRAMQRRYIKREYLGLVIGTPEDEAGTLEGPLGRDSHNRMKYAVRADGKIAITHFTVRERLRGLTEVVFRLETGRTHQIRVHMASYGCPILNDPVYGRRDRRLEIPGQALHAWKLQFRHPVTREYLNFEVPPPSGYLAAKALYS